MMICDLCLIKSEDPIAINGNEGNQCKLAILLQKYFSFCLSETLNFGFICRNCWSYVDNFHGFYIRIEEIHQSKVLQNNEPKEVICMEIEQFETPLLGITEVKTENNLENVNSNGCCEDISNGLF